MMYCIVVYCNVLLYNVLYILPFIYYIIAALNLLNKDNAVVVNTNVRNTRLRDTILIKKKEIMDKYAEYYRDCARKPHRNVA